MIEELKKNLNAELTMARELGSFVMQMQKVSPEEREALEEVIRSLSAQLGVLNASVKKVVEGISLAQKLTVQKQAPVERVEHLNKQLFIRKQDRELFLKELEISEKLIKKIRKKSNRQQTDESHYKKANPYAALANSLFLKVSSRLAARDELKKLHLGLKKSNMGILFTTYISVSLFTMALSAGIGIPLGIIFSFFVSSMVSKIGIILLTPIILPLITGAIFYFYPYTEQKSAASRIDSELPFVVIHMGSISGSGVEPSEIFRIVSKSKEYKHSRIEIRKLLNQVNIYGYDLVTALKNVARVTPSNKLAELLNGLSTTISSGGDLKTFFEKRAETLLLSYRLERERFSKVAETFMDIYISVVIATPMILLMLLIMISVSGFSVGFTVSQLTFGVIGVVALVNVVFLWILGMRQPVY